MRKITAYATAATVALGVLSFNMPDSDAAPVQPISAPITHTDLAPGIHWTAKRDGNSVVVATDAGSLAARDGQFQVLDATGTVVAGLPLAYDINGSRFPIAATIDGNTATLTPSTDPAAAKPVQMVTPVDAQADFDSALAAAGTQFGLATGVGALVGTIIGAVGGCVLGAIVPATLMTPIFVPGWVGGCIAGAAAGIALGAAAGTVLLGVPVGIASAIQFFQRLNTPSTPAPAGSGTAAPAA
ncbi:hypothetical protein [Nocardia sp. NPDC051570]|uniref:hypothetical protein n=1 Tax=Nocardia sp. NPDC051570 TaxID=3364324 RepID=UPI0037ACC3BF